MPVFSSGELNRKPPELGPEASRYCRARARVQIVHCKPSGRYSSSTTPSNSAARTSRIRRGAEALAPRRCHGWSEDSRLFGHPCFATRLGGVAAGKETHG